MNLTSVNTGPDLKNTPIVICYPPGAGGSFLASALNSALFQHKFNTGTAGDCHDNSVISVPHFVPNDNMQGIRDELSALDSILWPVGHNFVANGHVRNIVALQSLNYDLWFIKITFDCMCEKEINFLHTMLAAKVPLSTAIVNCYQQIKHHTWPDSVEEFLQSSDCNEAFREQNSYTLKNWFWVENFSTRRRTLELSIQDIFLGAQNNNNRDCFTLGEKLNRWFDKNTIDALFNFARDYQTVNKKLYPAAFDLLTH